MAAKHSRKFPRIFAGMGVVSICTGAATIRYSFFDISQPLQAIFMATTVFVSLLVLTGFFWDKFEVWFRENLMSRLGAFFPAVGKRLAFVFLGPVKPLWHCLKKRPSARRLAEIGDRLNERLEIFLAWFFFDSLVFKVCLLALFLAAVTYCGLKFYCSP